MLPTDLKVWQTLFDEHKDDHQMMSQMFTHALQLPIDDLFLIYIKYIKQSHPNFLIDAYQYSSEQLKFTFNTSIYKEYLALLPVDEINKIRNVYKQCFSMPRSNLSQIWEFYTQFESKDVIGQKQIEEMAKLYERSKLLEVDVHDKLEAFLTSKNPDAAHALMNLEHTNYCMLDEPVLFQRLKYLYLFTLSQLEPSPSFWLLYSRFLILLHKNEADTIELLPLEEVKVNDVVVPFIPKNLNEWIPLFNQHIQSQIAINVSKTIDSIPILCLALQWGYKCAFVEEFTSAISQLKEDSAALKSIIPKFTLYMSRLLVHSELTDMRQYFSLFRKWLNTFAQDATIDLLEILVQCSLIFSTSAWIEHKHTEQFTIQARIFELGFKWLNSVLSNQQTSAIVNVFIQYSKSYMQWLIHIKENENIKSLLTRLTTIVDRSHHPIFIQMVLEYCILNGECEWMYQLQAMVKEYKQTKEWSDQPQIPNKKFTGQCDLYYYLEKWMIYGMNSYESLLLKQCNTEEQCSFVLENKEFAVQQQQQQYVHPQQQSFPKQNYGNGDASNDSVSEKVMWEADKTRSSPLGLPNSDLVYGLLISLPGGPWGGPKVKVPELFAAILNANIPQQHQQYQDHRKRRRY